MQKKANRKEERNVYFAAAAADAVVALAGRMLHGGGSGGYGAGSDYQQQSQQQQQQHGQQLQAPVYVPSSRPAIPSAATAAQYHSFPTSASPAWYVIYFSVLLHNDPVKGLGSVTP